MTIIQYKLIIYTSKNKQIINCKSLEEAKKRMRTKLVFLKKFTTKKIWAAIEKTTIKKEFILDSDYKKLRLKVKKGVLLES